MMALLLEPLQFTFMSHALLISLVVSIPCALLSVFLVLKSWALMGDAMSHAVFPGIVLAWILGLPLATGAFVAGVFCAVATGYLKDNSRIKQDTVMGIVFSGMFAAGLILGTVAKLAMRQPFVLFKGLTFQKLCLPGAFRPGDHHNKMLRPGLCVVHASPQYL
ncbi:metal ABC transporter permease [Escherichia coli]